MPKKEYKYLNDKKILVVDDEPDVVDTIDELLPMCRITGAYSFAEGKNYLESQYFDIAILDIMGVDGFGLLEISKKRKILPVMLTAHALSPENTVKSYKEGAALYIPKERLSDIAIFLVDIWEAKEKEEHTWWRWLSRFSSYYERKFGPQWQNHDKEFWEKFFYT